MENLEELIKSLVSLQEEKPWIEFKHCPAIITSNRSVKLWEESQIIMNSSK